MRPLRVLKQGVWYAIHTRINNREPLFRHYTALALFAQVFRETKRRFGFEIRRLQLTDDHLTFYIKPEEGRELPAIMKRLKQVFAQRYNRKAGRIGHIWGDRYGSWIVEGEPPEEATEDRVGASKVRVRPFYGKTTIQTVFLHMFPFPTVPTPG